MELSNYKSIVKPKNKKRLAFLAVFYFLLLFTFVHFGSHTFCDEQMQILNLSSHFIISALVLSLSAFYFQNYYKSTWLSLRKLSLLALIVAFSFIFSSGFNLLAHHYVDYLSIHSQYPLLIPFASVLISLFLGSEIAFFVSTIISLLTAFTLDVDFSKFFIMNMLCSLTAILCTQNMYKQKQILTVFLKIWLVSVSILFMFHFSDYFFNRDLFLADLFFSLFFIIFSTVLVILLFPILEHTFKLTTAISLMELADPNHPLLRKFSLEAPGTYQHSLVVGNLSERAAYAIQANALFCRISSLYHDVGKLSNPHYFNENYMGGLNIHQLLTPKESAAVILSHIHEGELLAKRYKLPSHFIDVIKEHHGTSVVKHFYQKELELHQGDTEQVSLNDFRYMGPKPRTKESAIIMMADKIEAASRSLDNATEESIAYLVSSIIEEKISSGQLEESPLTFVELSIIKKEFIKTLVNVRHLRPK